jgi:ankyrin repeat protein
MNIIKQTFHEFYERNNYYEMDHKDSKFLLNSFINGQTLMYYACKEGKADIVKYFLDNNLNANILSKVNDIENENCLNVACRWNYKNVVELLLKRVDFTKDELINAMRSTTSGLIKVSIKKHIKNKKFVRCCL